MGVSIRAFVRPDADCPDREVIVAVVHRLWSLSFEIVRHVFQQQRFVLVDDDATRGVGAVYQNLTVSYPGCPDHVANSLRYVDELRSVASVSI